MDDSVETWEAHSNQLENSSTNLRRTNVLGKLTTIQPSPDETVTQYFAKLITFCRKLIGTTKYLTDDTINTPIFTTVSISYETTLKILEQQIPCPTPQQSMHAICNYAKRMTLSKEFGDASTRAALYSHG
jgi:hypothetical protein